MWKLRDIYDKISNMIYMVNYNLGHFGCTVENLNFLFFGQKYQTAQVGIFLNF